MRLEVPPQAAGERLDVFLAAHAGSRAAAQRMIEEGRVLLDGEAPRSKRHALHGGELVEIAEAEPRVVPDVAPARYSVAYEDPHLLVVDKPAGVVVHPARGHPEGTLVQALAGIAAGGDRPERPGIVHRLDRDTSGLMVVARSEEAHAALKALIAAREVTREYLGLVEGRPGARMGTIEAPLGRDRRVRTRVSPDSAAPRPAVTHFEIERALGEATLLRIRLETGRTHQIRAHLKAIGHPVAGDPEYGRAGLYGLRRQFLHAEHLTFTHPLTGERVDVRAPLPEDLAAVLRSVERGGATRPGRPT